jgi:hypothetical protein
MPRAAKKSNKTAPAKADRADGFINVAVSRTTRQGLHLLKDAMGVQGQAEVIERLVAIGLAIHIASR